MCYLGLVGDQLHVYGLLMSLSHLILLIGPIFWTARWVTLGMPELVSQGLFSPFHSRVRLRFKLAAGLGEPWCKDGVVYHRAVL